MSFKKGMCFFLFGTAVLLVATASGPFQRENLNKIRADGTQPPPPPIPWPSGTTTVPSLTADGTQPPPPPIPLPSAATTVPSLTADGTQPPPPPIPWPSGTTTVPSLTADGTQPPPPPIPWGQAVTKGKLQKVQIADGIQPLHRRYLGHIAQAESQHS